MNKLLRYQTLPLVHLAQQGWDVYPTANILQHHGHCGMHVPSSASASHNQSFLGVKCTQ